MNLKEKYDYVIANIRDKRLRTDELFDISQAVWADDDLEEDFEETIIDFPNLKSMVEKCYDALQK